MQITVSQRQVFWLLDTLVARWRAKEYPYNRRDAIIPQNVIPKELRADKRTLACFYFYLCIYMRGGIESLQAFQALIRMWQKHPELFQPEFAQWLQPSDIQPLLKQYVGWDSAQAARTWIENSRRLMSYWDGNPLNLLKGLHTFDEACRRMRNKLTKRDLREAGQGGQGLVGFQYKMVSMLLYFYDWERWLKPRFLYPSPADFHNFRLAFNVGGLTAEHLRADDDGTIVLRVSEEISALWRAAVMAYLKRRKADPVEVADALWLYSLVMCGNSPLTVTKTVAPRAAPLFPSESAVASANGKVSRALLESCCACALAEHCTLAIPARSYYGGDGVRGGRFELRQRAPTETSIDPKLIRVPTTEEPGTTQTSLAL